MAPGSVDADLLQRDLAEAREHLAATSEVLGRPRPRRARTSTPSSGPSSTAARQLCRADAALIYLLDGDVYRVARASGVTDGGLATTSPRTRSSSTRAP